MGTIIKNLSGRRPAVCIDRRVDNVEMQKLTFHLTDESWLSTETGNSVRLFGCDEPKIDRKYHIIAIASGKGGVGKTSIATNLGIMLTRLHKKVTLIDMDLAMPNVEILTGLKNPPVGIIDVVEGKLDFKHITYTGPEGMRIIPPGIMLDGYSKKETVDKIAELFKNLPTDNDYIILDMPPGREAIEVLSGDIGVLLVVNSDKPSILDAVNMKALLERKNVKVLGVILNRHERDLDVIYEIEKVLDTKVVAVVPDSKIVKNAFHDEECFVITNADSVPSQELMDLAKEIVGSDIQTANTDTK